MLAPRRLLQLLVSFALLLCAGCLELQQDIVIREDGTGDFDIYASVPSPQYKAWLASPQVPATQQWANYFDPTQGATSFTAANGFDLQSYRVFEKDGRQHIQIKGKLTNARQALESGIIGHWVMTTGPADNHTIAWQPASSTPLDATPDQLKVLTRGLKLTLTITTPRPHVTTTAQQTQGKQAIWRFNSSESTDFLISPPNLTLTY